MISTRLSKTSHNNISLKVVYNSDLLFFLSFYKIAGLSDAKWQSIVEEFENYTF